MAAWRTITTATALALLLSSAPAGAAEGDVGNDATAPAADTGDTEPGSATAAPPDYPRKIYDVDDVGLIIGGASEDAKAKVGRLPVRD